MLRNKMSLAVDYLEAGDEIKKMIQNLKGKCIDPSHSRDTILDVEATIKNAKIDRSNNKLPYYFIFLAYAYHLISNWTKAIHYAERAEAQFNMNGQKQNQAISLWMLGLLLCQYEQLEDAKSRVNEATTIISLLNEDICRSGKYTIPNNAYQYEDIISDIEISYSELKIQVLEQTSTKQSNPTLRFDFFSRIIALLLISQDNDFKYLAKWRDDIINFEPSELPNDEFFIDKILERLDRIQDQIERALIRILLAHRYELGYYARGQQGQEAEKFSQEAIDLFEPDDVNYFLSCCYLDLLYYNNDVEGVGRSHLEHACRLLVSVQEEYKNFGFEGYSKEIQDLQNDIRAWVFPFGFNDASRENVQSSTQEFVKPTPLEKNNTGDLQKDGFNEQMPQQPSKWIDLKTITKHIKQGFRTSRKSSEESSPAKSVLLRRRHNLGPAPTDMRKNKSVTSLVSLTQDNKPIPPKQDEPPEPPESESPSPSGEDYSGVRLIVIPVDMNALKKKEMNDSLENRDVIEELAKYDEEYAKLKGRPQSDINRNTTYSRRTVISSYPIRGQATANPKGEAELPSADDSMPFMAPIVDDTMIIRIQNRSYKVYLAQGITEIRGNANAHDWFLVDGDSMNDADPISIEDKDYVLFNKRNRNPGLYDGKIVLVSIRDNNIDPTRLMIKRFVFMSPKQHAGLDVTTPFLLSESQSKRYKATEFTDEYQVEGEVVAIAKLINK